MRLAGKTALVTGGSRGIGKAIVCALAREGAKVAFVYHPNTEAANTLVRDLELDQREVIAIQGNVRVKSEADAIVQKLIDDWGKLDIRVNNAGRQNGTAAGRGRG